MATMKKFRVVLEITLHEDSSEPDYWDWERVLKGNFVAIDDDYNEEVSFVEQECLETWESDEDEDEDDEKASCPFDEGERVKLVATTSEVAEDLGITSLEAARIAGHAGKVVDTDPGSHPEVKVEFDNGELWWVNQDHLAMAE